MMRHRRNFCINDGTTKPDAHVPEYNWYPHLEKQALFGKWKIYIPQVHQKEYTLEKLFIYVPGYIQ